jgi:hypothetical protein
MYIAAPQKSHPYLQLSIRPPSIRARSMHAWALMHWWTWVDLFSDRLIYFHWLPEERIGASRDHSGRQANVSSATYCQWILCASQSPSLALRDISNQCSTMIPKPRSNNHAENLYKLLTANVRFRSMCGAFEAYHTFPAVQMTRATHDVLHNSHEVRVLSEAWLWFECTHEGKDQSIVSVADTTWELSMDDRINQDSELRNLAEDNCSLPKPGYKPHDRRAIAIWHAQLPISLVSGWTLNSGTRRCGV